MSEISSAGDWDSRTQAPPASTIRAARAADDAALRALDAATWSWDASPAPPRPPEAPFFSFARDPTNVLVALVDDAVAGYAELGPATPLKSNRHVLEMKGLAVDPALRRRGLGRRLVAAAAREASARGARRLRLRVLAPNAGARRLYEACGFELEGVLREEFKLDENYVDDLLMALALASPATARADR